MHPFLSPVVSVTDPGTAVNTNVGQNTCLNHKCVASGFTHYDVASLCP